MYFYFYDLKIDYYGKNEDNIYTVIEDINKSKSCCYEVRVQLYNSSEVIKVLRDIQIEFELESKTFYNKPHNSDEAEQHQHYMVSHDLNLINIPPKQLIEIDVDGTINDEDMIQVSKVKRIYFIAKNHKNKKIKKLIKKF
ncbi:hypothetical protein ACTFJW_16925 [Clostridium cagae]|uniref:hypothetical protein n=1 Tax=Clostridium cagae TaxID=2080751 RepID=UPI003F76A838